MLPCRLRKKTFHSSLPILICVCRRAIRPRSELGRRESFHSAVGPSLSPPCSAAHSCPSNRLRLVLPEPSMHIDGETCISNYCCQLCRSSRSSDRVSAITAWNFLSYACTGIEEYRKQSGDYYLVTRINRKANISLHPCAIRFLHARIEESKPIYGC